MRLFDSAPADGNGGPPPPAATNVITGPKKPDGDGKPDTTDTKPADKPPVTPAPKPNPEKELQERLARLEDENRTLRQTQGLPPKKAAKSSGWCLLDNDED